MVESVGKQRVRRDGGEGVCSPFWLTLLWPDPYNPQMPATSTVPPDTQSLSVPQESSLVLPGHVAVVMDGNGRWARSQGLDRVEGHKAGTRTAHRVVEHARRRGVSVLTLFAFSSENWKRPAREVAALMGLLADTITQKRRLLLDHGIRLRLIGDIQGLAAPLRMALDRLCRETANLEDMTLVMALNYGGRLDIVQAARKLLAEGCRPEELDEERFASALWTKDLVDPDLIIRTSGEQRLSNFLLFQGAYSELYFTPKPWPDFDEHDFDAALEAFRARQRRFGGVDPA